MQVICVRPIDKPSASAKGRPKPEVGDTDTVLGHIEMYGHQYYTFERFGEDNGYRCDHFATLPSATDERAIEAEQEAIIYAR